MSCIYNKHSCRKGEAPLWDLFKIYNLTELEGLYVMEIDKRQWSGGAFHTGTLWEQSLGREAHRVCLQKRDQLNQIRGLALGERDRAQLGAHPAKVLTGVSTRAPGSRVSEVFPMASFCSASIPSAGVPVSGHCVCVWVGKGKLGRPARTSNRNAVPV